ncbi:hypothetical protein KAR91_37595 [Candidatus Pacearchaeota archaeon]|nr:hypothetical protein [Candidatus Pacearchaeota archaeon]
MGVFNDFKNYLKRKSISVNRMLRGEMLETYNLNSAQVVDAAKARAIYNNTDNEYKLAGGMARVIINSDAAFIGMPIFKSTDKNTNDFFEKINKTKAGFYTASHTAALKEADVYIWVQWDPKENNVRWVSIPQDKLKDIIYNPVTSDILKYVFEWQIDYKDGNSKDVSMKVRIEVTAEAIVYDYSGTVPDYIEKDSNGKFIITNILGVIPIVQLSNEKGLSEVKGHSEITAIEPYRKAYHDVLMMAMQAQKNNSAPKLKLKVADADAFVSNNWGADAVKLRRDGKVTYSVKDLDLVVLEGSDDAEYMTLSSTTGSAEPLLKILFTLIVETSETIEVVFGANLGTSLASVESQLPVYVEKIKRKRTQYQEAWEEVINISLQLYSYVTFKNYSTDYTTTWTVVDFESAKAKAEILKNKMVAYKTAIDSHIMSFEEVHGEMKEVIPSILPNYEKHKTSVDETGQLLMKYELDESSQGLENE